VHSYNHLLLVARWRMGKHLTLLADVVFEFKSFNETPLLARKCGHGEPTKPRLLYPLVWIPCCDTVS
jgi:hypothetical protein